MIKSNVNDIVLKKFKFLNKKTGSEKGKRHALIGDSGKVVNSLPMDKYSNKII